MSTPFQNRLVGTIIVAAAAIIFLPDLLDGEKKAFQQQFDEIPDKPEIKINNELKSFPDEMVSELNSTEVVDEQALDELIATAQNDAQSGADKAVADTQESTDTVANLESDAERLSSQTSALNEPSDTTNSASQTQEQKTKVVATPAKPIELPKQVEHGSAWVIQLGSFRSKQNVNSLLAKLKLNNYAAFTRPISTRSGEMTKVYIGPEIDRSKLETQLEPLFNLTQVRGKISRFTPK